MLGRELSKREEPVWKDQGAKMWQYQRDLIRIMSGLKTEVRMS